MIVHNRPFVAILAKQPEIGDEIIIKGKLKDDANVFSVNFCLDCDEINPSYIAYHFKTIFETNTVIHNYKSGEWNEEIIEDNTWILGPGEEFTLTFHFTENEILVYTEDDGRSYQYQFSHKFNINQIECVQVWDDIEYIREIIFRYKTK